MKEIRHTLREKIYQKDRKGSVEEQLMREDRSKENEINKTKRNSDGKGKRGSGKFRRENLGEG
jgi:hypothetical protein